MHVAGALFALAVLAPLGAGLLMLLDGWRLAGGLLRAGLVVFAGLAGGAVLLPWLLYLGGDVSLWWVLAVGVVVLIAGLMRLPRLPDEHAFVRLEPVGAAAIAIPTVLLAVDAVAHRVDGYDAFANWSLKAKLIWAAHGLPHWAFGASSTAPPVARRSPLGLPALEAVVLHGTHGNFRAAQLLFALLPAGLACVVWTVLRPRVPLWPLAAGVSLLLWLPALRRQALTADADVPLACFFVAAVLLAAARQWPVAALFAAAALATERDAVAACVVLAVVALVRWPRRPLVLAAAAAALTTVPWRVWIAAHDLPGGPGFSAVRLANNLGRTGWVLHRFGEILLGNELAWVVPIAAGAALVLLLFPDDRELAFGVLVLGAALVAALLVVYVTGSAGVGYLVRTSAARALLPTATLAAAVLPLLVWRTLCRWRS